MSPDKRQHRGPYPEDKALFSQEQLNRLGNALQDLYWLLNHHYALNSSLKLVGDKFDFNKRQRLALTRSVCTESQTTNRLRKQSNLNLANILLIDGFNLLITIEAALSGGLILAGMDTCYRDLASVHGSYRSVTETRQAIHLIGNYLDNYSLENIIWYLDKPVSNSGKLGGLIREMAEAHNWPWQVEVVINPDNILKQAKHPVVTSDSSILDETYAWVNLARDIIHKEIPSAWIVDFRFDFETT